MLRSRRRHSAPSLRAVNIFYEIGSPGGMAVQQAIGVPGAAIGYYTHPMTLVAWFQLEVNSREVAMLGLYLSHLLWCQYLSRCASD